MPLKLPELPAEPEHTRLPWKTAAAAFLLGTCFIIAPVPYFLVNRTSIPLMLATACIPPVCGSLLMSFLVARCGGIKMLHCRALSTDDLIHCLKWTFVIILLYSAVNALWKHLLEICAVPFTENQFLMQIAATADCRTFLLLAFLVLIPVPVAEELLFRRILYAGLLPAGRKTALIGSAAAFAAAHLFLAGLPGLVVIGAGFQLLYLSRKNLMCSIASHAMLNGCSLLATLIQRMEILS